MYFINIFKNLFSKSTVTRAAAVVSSLVLATSITGCISTLDGETYSRGEARKVAAVAYGQVQATRPVVIEGTKSQIGPAAGGVVGGIAGSTVGDGTGQALATAVGAIVGGIAGAFVEESATRSQGIELTIQQENGPLIAVVQEMNENQSFPIGTRVQLVRSGSTLRAIPVRNY